MKTSKTPERFDVFAMQWSYFGHNEVKPPHIPLPMSFSAGQHDPTLNLTIEKAHVKAIGHA
jgi:hypothetical protein